MHDTNLEERLRSVLRQEGDGLPFTVTTEELERRLALRRRARTGQRRSLMAAGLAVLAVGAVLALGSGWLRGTNVAADPSPSPTATGAPSPHASASPDAVVTPSPAASADPLAALPVIEDDPASLDYYTTEDPGDPSNNDSTLVGRYLDGVRMDAREAGIKVACIGPDAELEWGVNDDPTVIASEPVACDGTVKSFRFDVSAYQPMLYQPVFFNATPGTAFRLVIASYGSMNDPVPTSLPSFALPPGTIVSDVTSAEGAVNNDAPVAMQAGKVPQRGVYRVVLVCLGEGTARWSIGGLSERDFVASDEVECDGAAIAFENAEGIPPTEAQVWVTTDPANTWRIVVIDPYGAPSFIAPQLNMWNGTEIGTATVAGLARCVSHGDGGDSCAGPFSARDGAAEVSVPLDGEITFALADGWGMREARVTAIPRDAARSDPFATPTEIIYYSLGGDQRSASLAGLEAGEWIIRVSGGGRKGSDSFGGFYDIPVIIGG